MEALSVAVPALLGMMSPNEGQEFSKKDMLVAYVKPLYGYDGCVLPKANTPNTPPFS